MARKSKRDYLREEKVSEIQNIYNVAVYARLSMEEKKQKNNTVSIEYQKEIIYDYLKDKNDMVIYSVYCDDGATGTNFERPEFQRMMYDIYNGKVNCIIVKDLSRFGREYIETGEYLEKIFPLIGVRFIAINDNHDNMVEPFNITVPIKNIINSFYVRDLSKKSAAALRIKQINGEYIGTYAVYGYIKSPEDNHKLIIDEEAAAVVRMIFNYKLQGYSNQQICRKLFEQNIMPPVRYKYEKGISTKGRYSDNIYWSDSTISDMLKNEMYIGNMVQGKTRTRFVGYRQFQTLPRDEWHIVEGTHEPIISKEVFNKVQEIIAEYKRTNGNRFNKKYKDSPNIFKNKIFCGECGGVYKRHRYLNSKRRMEYSYMCKLHTKYPTECDCETIKGRVLNNLVLTAIKAQVLNMANLEKVFEGVISNKDTLQKRYSINTKIGSALSKIAELKKQRVRLSVDLTKKLIDEDEYVILRDRYNDELERELLKLKEVEKEQGKFNKILSIKSWIDELKRYGRAKKLTQEIVDAFIKKVTIYKHERIEIEWLHTDTFANVLKTLEEGEHLA